MDRNCLTSELSGLLCIAERCKKKGDFKAAETLLQHALKKAEDRYGRMSIPAAVVLLELVELYEDSNDEESAESHQKRMRDIIVHHIH